MKEQDFLKIIEKQIGNEFIGDDCAFLKEFGIVITQDNLIENIHFKREWYTPFQLGYKSAAVNISDILASGAEPKYLTVALALTNDIDKNFVEDFYKGLLSVSSDVKIIGGDITGSQNGISISVTAIGSTLGRNIASRKFAKPGYAVITKGNFGSSAAGLEKLLSGYKTDNALILAHLQPVLEHNFSKEIGQNINNQYAMMDSSDGLADALFKIAEAGNVTIKVNFDKIPKESCVTKEQVLFGGEDYKLIACVPESELYKLSDYVKIGTVKKFDGIYVKIDEYFIENYDDIKSFNHFKN